MPHIYTISFDYDFLKTLAAGLWREAGGDSSRLSEMTVFLPTRRACRALREAFLDVAHARACLLPRLCPLGDIEDEATLSETLAADLPPAIAPLRRTMLLVRALLAKDKTLPLDRAADLAGALASLLDTVQREEKSFSDFKGLVPENFAAHWQETLRFLSILTQTWPQILAEEGCMDPAARRRRVLDAMTEEWRKLPPGHPVIIAGSTGSEPAAGRLMAQVARLPQGAVILPGLDLEAEEAPWQAIEETHAQFTMKKWLENSSFSRADVSFWQNATPRNAARLALLRAAMTPPDAAESWREGKEPGLLAEGCKGLEKIELEHKREEADIIALRLRAVLEEPSRTAALVTPDRALARRVASSLKRWGVEVDDTAGEPLDTLALGAFFKLVLAAAEPAAGPVDFLALLKHPLTFFGSSRPQVLARARRAEEIVWRGVRPSGGWTAAARIAGEKDPDLGAWLTSLASLFKAFADKEEKTVQEHIATHLAIAETLASGEGEDGAARLWRSVAGQAAAAWFEDLRAAGQGFGSLTVRNYARLVGGLMKNVTVRPLYGSHPRLHILGPLEARLLRHDVTVLGGLNEKTWPGATPVDPWLSRPMKKALGLFLPEVRVGLAAHDFVSAAAGDVVLLTRAKREGGTQTVPSRFLLRLGACLTAAGQKDIGSAAPWEDWARLLSAPESYAPMEKPAPCPPLEVRPKKLSVTEIGTWRRNPYAIYAKRILGLEKLDDIDADVSAAEKGEAIHKALETFLRAVQDVWPGDPLALLMEEGRQAFAPFADRPQIEAFWGPRFARLARQFVQEEAARREEGRKPFLIEARGEVVLDGFTLSGRADRIEALPDGRIEVVDYKTGAIPEKKAVMSGYEPQLPLLAYLAREGGFGGKALDPAGLAYWGVKGGAKDDKKTTFTDEETKTLIVHAAQGLRELISSYARAEMAYLATPRPRFALVYDDYAHLARYAEWSREDAS